ncbi:MAG: outer membrane protein assembly factor BamD [Bacteroidales bacterium]|jgi:outer membrane protein assembly factor BamD|nr:outer membrane protein assembly factor BamD [Bacteroidales bacterium]MBQ5747951.1 outer membrane protein assembly factor BamD [Bacteroidales bacterium]MBQ5882452.1 outer membrane protein assembly factor BamD [Bacteroidales bacterium]MBR4974617.1 outer membrane protein assembly factor BamD [Bacteroidales bacterium]
MKKLTYILSLVMLLGMVSCKTQYDMILEGNDIPAKYKMAFELFEKEKYTKAASMFESMKMGVRGTSMEDTVQFYTAYSYYMWGDVYTAEQGFNSFVGMFPLSPFTQRARFLYVDCLYEQTYRYELDQTPTYKALDAIYEFIRDYPDDANVANCRSMSEDLEERLDRKAYEAAKLYYTIEDYRAATYALKLVIKEDADNIYREDIMYYVVLSSYKYALNSVFEKQRERYMDFADEYFTFVTEFPESSYRRELDALSNKVNKILERK